HLMRRASSLLPRHHPIRLALLQSLGVALEETGPLEQAPEVLRDAQESGREAGNTSVELLAATRLVYLWLILSPEATHEQAIAELDQLVARFEDLKDDRGIPEGPQALGTGAS